MSLDSSAPTKATFSKDHLSVFDPLHIVLNLCTIQDLRFFPSDVTAYVFCLQLMMQPQGKCVQCLDKTNTGVTVVARRVSIKLSISKGRLLNPKMCWTAMWICKSRELQTYPKKMFSTLPSLFPQGERLLSLQLPSPGPFPIWELEAPLLSWHHWFWATRILWEEASFLGLHRLLRVSTPECLVCAGCQLKFPPEKHSSQHEKTLSQKTGKHLWNLYLVLQMSFVISLAPQPCQAMLVTLGHHLPLLSSGSLLEAWTKAGFVYSLFSLLVVMPLLSSWWGWAATLLWRNGAKMSAGQETLRIIEAYTVFLHCLPPFLNTPRRCSEREHPWPWQIWEN